MGNYAAYPAYKASGVEWLGEIPAHWIVKKIGYVAVQNSGGAWGSEDDESDGTIILRSTEQTIDGKWQIENPARRLLTPTEKRQTLLVAGDLLITKSSGSKLHIGKTTIVDHEVESLQCGFSNFMQRLRLKQEQCPKFYYYLFNSKVGREQFDFNSNTTTGLANLNGTVISATLSALPPLPEQEAIARFLDNKTAQIDGLIAKKEALLARLADKRTALISQAVTKGLDPRVPMRDSGVEWLGEIPAHWRISRLRFVLTTNPSRNEIRLGEDEPVSFVPMEAVGEYGGLNLEIEKPLEEIGSGYTYFANRDVVVAKITPCFENGKGALVAELVNGVGFGTTELHVLRASRELNEEFLFYLTISQVFRKLGEAEMYGAGGQKRVPESFIRDMRLGIPPLPEQKAIARVLDHKTLEIDEQIAKIQAAIDKLKEYRTALITGAVTGKIDVRGVA